MNLDLVHSVIDLIIIVAIGGFMIWRRVCIRPEEPWGPRPQGQHAWPHGVPLPHRIGKK